MIIGVDHPILHLSLEEKWGSNGEPIARRHETGLDGGRDQQSPEARVSAPTSPTPSASEPRGPQWIWSSRLPSRQRQAPSKTAPRAQQNDHQTSRRPKCRDFRQLRDLFEDQIKVDVALYDNTTCATPAEEAALATLRSSRRLVSPNRYEVAVLWRANEPDLPNNYFAAAKRLTSLLASKKMTADITRRYDEVIADWTDKGLRQGRAPRRAAAGHGLLPSPLPRGKDGEGHYESPPPLWTEKPSSNGKSLNDCVSTGPNLMNDLPLVLTRFRRKPIAVGADVASMFLQVRLRKQDRPLLRFLWTRPGTSQPVEYEHCVHIFGAACSPVAAMFCAQEAAREKADQYPRAAESILDSTIVR